MVILIIIFFSFSFADQYINGRVLDVKGEPIPNVNIQLMQGGFGYISNNDGYFILNKSLNLNSYIQFSHIGYKDKKILIDSSMQDFFSIILEENILEFKSTVITSTRKDAFIKDVPVLTHVISSQQISNSAYTSVKDILELALPNVQNVVSNHAGTSNNRVKVQGLDNKYLLFLIDGVRVSGEFAGNLDFNMLDTYNIDKIEVVEGGMSSLYGSSAIGGVVNIITKKNSNPYWLDFSYFTEDYMLSSNALSAGFNYKNIYYNLDYSIKNSPGYDLTSSSQTTSGVIIKTLEEYESANVKHNLIFHFNDNYSIGIVYNNYQNNIYQYENHLVQVLDSGSDLFPSYYYKTYKNNLPRFEDIKYGIKLSHENEKSYFKLEYNSEDYIKKNYFFNYSNLDCSDGGYSDYFCNNSGNLIAAEYINATNYNQNILLQYNRNISKHNLMLGFEINNDSYSSFNIYGPSGDIDSDGACGSVEMGEVDDCLVESIFDGNDGVRDFKKRSFFFGDQFSIENGDIVSFSYRYVKSENYKDNNAFSFAYVLKKHQPYDLRFNYSRGFRTPAIKELYYDFQGHSPPIVGSQNLKPTVNDYFSFSIDNRNYNRNTSFEVFYNNVKDMIGIKSDLDQFGNSILIYSNFNKVNFQGFNFHYNKKIRDKHDFKFVYNYTMPSSHNKEALELISKNSLRFTYKYDIIVSELSLQLNVKYAGDKFILDGQETIVLDDYLLSDVVFLIKASNSLNIKLGVKNIKNYLDDRRLLSNAYLRDILTSYDPGYRYFFEFKVNI